ncbi:MAG: hypothetical protein RBU37_06640 [Myxococcota bacterium]|nr:hypothetical protein [Myxococcota bacterium]
MGQRPPRTTWGNRPSAQSTKSWGTGQAPNRQKVGGTGQAPNRQEIKGILESLERKARRPSVAAQQSNSKASPQGARQDPARGSTKQAAVGVCCRQSGVRAASLVRRNPKGCSSRWKRFTWEGQRPYNRIPFPQ